MRLFCVAICFPSLMLPCTGRAQSFSRVAITPSASTDTREGRLQILPRGDLLARAIPFLELFALAYDVPDDPSPRVSPMPDWTVSQRFDIEAKVPVPLKLDSEDISTQQRAIQQLIRSLLCDRFGLEVTVRTERVPVYDSLGRRRRRGEAEVTVRGTEALPKVGSPPGRGTFLQSLRNKELSSGPRSCSALACWSRAKAAMS